MSSISGIREAEPDASAVPGVRRAVLDASAVVAEFDARVAERVARGERWILGITGPPGAGKSTLAERLAARAGADAALVPMDGFHLANNELARLGRSERKGAPDTFDRAGFIALLRRLRTPAAREIVYAPQFRREIEEPIAGAIAVGPEHQIVITEGNYLLLARDGWSAVRPLLDEVWYIDIASDLRVARLIARHVAFGRTPVAARDWVIRSDEANAELIAATRGRADRIVRL